MYINIKTAEQTILLLNTAREVIFKEYKFIAMGTIISKSVELLDKYWKDLDWNDYIPTKGILVTVDSKRLNLTVDAIDKLRWLSQTYRLSMTEAIHTVLSAAIAYKQDELKKHETTKLQDINIVNLNVNNFGGLNSKPLIKDFMDVGVNNVFAEWKKAVESWRVSNKNDILENVSAICAKLRNYDVVVLEEVDTNCDSFCLLKKEMKNYEMIVPNGYDDKTFNKGNNSITCMFLKKSIKCEIVETNFSSFKSQKDYKNVEIEIENGIHIIGVHVPKGNILYWEDMKQRFLELQNSQVLFIGDMNVYDFGTPQKQKFFEMLRSGAVDLWVEKGNSMDTPTANTHKRIDYALTNEKMVDSIQKITIDDWYRNSGRTDHSAIIVNLSLNM